MHLNLVLFHEAKSHISSHSLRLSSVYLINCTELIKGMKWPKITLKYLFIISVWRVYLI